MNLFMSTINLKMSKRKYQIQEPTPKNTLDSKEYESEVYSVYATYKSISESKEHKKWILDYVKFLNKDASVYSRGKIKDYSPYGIWARLIVRGITIPDKEKDELDNLLKRLEEKNNEYLQSRQNAIQERTKKYEIQIQDILTSINVNFDKLYEHIVLRKKNQFNTENFSRITVPSNLYCIVIEHITQKLNEMYAARDKTDEQLVEAYSFLTKSQIKNYILYLEKILNLYNDKLQTNKKIRKPRKKKEKTAEQLVKNLKYLEKDESGILVSINPTLIIGSQSVCILNVKTKSMIIYHAKDGETILVKGSSLLNIDDNKSLVKKIRNFEDSLKNKVFNFPTFNHASKYFSSLKTKESKPKNRINVNSIILAIKK